MRILLITICALTALLAGCLKPAPTPKLAGEPAVLAAYVLEFPDQPAIAPAPEAVQDRIGQALASRGMRQEVIDFGTIHGPFERKRSTADRLELLAAQAEAAGAPFVFLFESEARFYSLLSGRYRWNVYGKITIARTADILADADTQDFDLAAFLEYEHQDEADALRYLKVALAEQTGQLLDRFVGGLDADKVWPPPAKATRAPEVPAPEPFPGQ